MSRDLDADKRLIETIEKGSNNVIEVVLAFADCDQLGAWRLGLRKVLDAFGQYQTLVSAKGKNFRGFEATLIQQICAQQKRHGNTIFSQTTKQINTYLKTLSDTMQMHQINMLGVLNETPRNCSIIYLQKMTTEYGDPKTQFGITTTTLLNGKVVTLNMYTRYDGEDSLTEIRRKHEFALKALLEAN